MNPRSIAYLAVPYSHSDPTVMEQRFQLVNHAAAKLIARGEVIFSPISHNHPVKNAAAGVLLPNTWEFWESYDIAFLSRCHKLYVLMLSGWSESIGVAAEVRYAVVNKIPVEYIGLHEL